MSLASLRADSRKLISNRESSLVKIDFDFDLSAFGVCIMKVLSVRLVDSDDFGGSTESPFVFEGRISYSEVTLNIESVRLYLLSLAP